MLECVKLQSISEQFLHDELGFQYHNVKHDSMMDVYHLWLLRNQ